MNICLICKKEMECTKTGVVAVWNKNHCYAGDQFECKACDAKVLVIGISTQPYYANGILKDPRITTVDMEE